MVKPTTRTRRIPIVHVALCLILAFLMGSAACSRSPAAQKARFMEAGRRFYDQKDYARAILQFKNAVDIAPLDPEPSYRLGLAYLDSGMVAQAAANFRRAATIDPKHAGAQLRLSELLELTADKDLLAEAETRLKIVLDTAPSGQALNALALAELKLNRADDAQQHLDEALARFPQNLSSYVISARLKILKQDFAGAEAVLKNAVQASSSAVEAMVALGDFYVARNNLEQAEKLFRQASEADPHNGSPLFELAMVEYRAGQKAEAEELFKRVAAFPSPAYRSVHAIFLLKEGRPEEGIAELERVVRDSPQDRNLRTQLVAAYWTAHRTADVERVVSATLKKNPKDFDALLQRAELYLVQQKFTQAQQDLNEVLYYRPESAPVHYIMAKLNQARGADVTYRKELNDALRLGPGLLQARLELAQNLIATGGAASALKILDETPASQKNLLAVLIQRNWALHSQNRMEELRKGVEAGLAVSREPDLIIQSAWVRLAEKNFQAARALVDEALKKAPGDARALQALAAIYTSQKQEGALGQRLQQYAASSPSPEVQLLVGEWFRQNGRNDQAKEFFQAAKRADPNFQEADEALAQMAMSEGKFDTARAILAPLLQRRDQDVKIRTLTAVLESSNQHYDEAISQYKQVLAIDRNNFFALNNLAYLLASSNRADEALAYAQQAQELVPNSAAVEDTLGWVLYHKGIYSAAVSHLEGAAQKTTDPTIQYHLGFALLKAGNQARGQQVLMNALRIAPGAQEAAVARREMGIGQ